MMIKCGEDTLAFEKAEIEDFCAMIVYRLFRFIDDYDRDLIDKSPFPMRVAECDKQKLFKAICREHIEVAGCMSFFMGDNESGVAYRYIFPKVPKYPFIICVNKEHYRVAPSLSRPYVNPNSGNTVKHLTVVIQKTQRPR